jgi:hypothetical protein
VYVISTHTHTHTFTKKCMAEGSRFRFDVEKTTSAGLTSIELAAQRGHMDAIMHLGLLGGRMNPFHKNIPSKSREHVAALLLFARSADHLAIETYEKSELDAIQAVCERAMDAAKMFRAHALKVLPSEGIHLTSEPQERVLEYCGLAPQYKTDARLPFMENSAHSVLTWYKACSDDGVEKKSNGF